MRSKNYKINVRQTQPSRNKKVGKETYLDTLEAEDKTDKMPMKVRLSVVVGTPARLADPVALVGQKPEWRERSAV